MTALADGAYAGIAALLAEHKMIENSAGNGTTEPREAWAECTCGAAIWEWQEYYNERTDEPEERFAEHLAWVIAEWATEFRQGPITDEAVEAAAYRYWLESTRDAEGDYPDFDWEPDEREQFMWAARVVLEAAERARSAVPSPTEQEKP